MIAKLNYTRAFPQPPSLPPSLSHSLPSSLPHSLPFSLDKSNSLHSTSKSVTFNDSGKINNNTGNNYGTGINNTGLENTGSLDYTGQLMHTGEFINTNSTLAFSPRTYTDLGSSFQNSTVFPSITNICNNLEISFGKYPEWET